MNVSVSNTDKLKRESKSGRRLAQTISTLWVDRSVAFEQRQAAERAELALAISAEDQSPSMHRGGESAEASDPADNSRNIKARGSLFDPVGGKSDSTSGQAADNVLEQPLPDSNESSAEANARKIAKD